MTTPLETPGDTQEMFCIPLKKLNAWLFSINPLKVDLAKRARVVQYQEECFEVLYGYWHKGRAENPRHQEPPRLEAPPELPPPPRPPDFPAESLKPLPYSPLYREYPTPLFALRLGQYEKMLRDETAPMDQPIAWLRDQGCDVGGLEWERRFLMTKFSEFREVAQQLTYRLTECLEYP